jgi:hypothetical protein
MLAIAFTGYVTWRLLHFTLTSPRVDAELLSAGACTFILMALVWAFGYLLISAFDPNAFTFPTSQGDADLTPFEALYFSLSTITTTGFGDIVPAVRSSRILATMEATVGVFYMATVMARLVSAYAPGRGGSAQPRP